MHPFRAAVEAGDMDAGVALLADDVVFRSPVVHTPYRGRDAVGPLLHAVFHVFEDFRYVKELEDGPDHLLVFETRVGEKSVNGIDLLHTDAHGRIDEFTVMVRPLQGTLALAAAMKALLEAQT